MLWLLFSVGRSRYAIDTSRVSQVTPRVELRAVPGTSNYVVGLLDLAGTICPVVDLGLRLNGQPCAERLSTRIVVGRIEHGGRSVPLGLIGEGVTELHEAGPEAGVPVRGSMLEDMLGPVLRIGGELVQWIDIDRVLTDAEKSWLYERVTGSDA